MGHAAAHGELFKGGFVWQQMKCNLDVDVRFRTALVVLYVSAGPRVDHTIAVGVIAGQVNITFRDQVQLIPVVRPRTKSVKQVGN